MANGRTYRVLIPHGGQHVPDRQNPTLVDLGIHAGHDAKAAIEAALGEHGLPSENCKLGVGVPTNNWSEYDIAPDPRPQFKVTPRRDSPDPEDAT